MTASYHCERQSDYVVGHLARGVLDIVRGRKRHRMLPGDLSVWDPSGQRRGSCGTDEPWEARILVVELPTMAEVAADPDGCVLDLEFPRPVLDDRPLAAAFLRLHRTLTTASSLLEHQSGLLGWLQRLTGLSAGNGARPQQRRSARRDPALRRACELMHDEIAADLRLADLADAAGTSQYRLTRLFNAGLGVPPHAYQIQLRVQRARALLEAGRTPTATAHLVGFYDQSHLNRHLTPRIGLTPARYARAAAAA